MIEPAVVFPLFVMGLVSSAHCIGMCGGIMGALTMAIPQNAKASRWLILVAYNLGRIFSYTVMGAVAGLFARQFAALGGGIILRVLAGTLLIAMGLYLADWWRGLTKLETVGRYLWVYIQPVGKRLMPVTNVPKGFLLGALWGWLPCGLVYAALAMAMTQPSAIQAASGMLAFGLGTLPSVLAAGVAAQQLTRILQQRKLRMALAIIMIAFGLWTISGSLSHSHTHHQHANSDDNSAMDQHVGMDHSHMNHGEENEATNETTVYHSSMHHPMTPVTSERQRTDSYKSSVEDRSSDAYSSAQSTETGEVIEHHH